MNSIIFYILFLLILPILKKGSKILKTCGWSSSIAQKDYLKFVESKATKSKLEEKWKIHVNPEGLKGHTSKGERNLKNLIAMLKKADQIGWRRSPDQVRFHKAFIAACLQRIMQEDINKDLVRVMKEYDLDEMRNDVIICTPRRWGKTTAVALFV